MTTYCNFGWLTLNYHTPILTTMSIAPIMCTTEFEVSWGKRDFRTGHNPVLYNCNYHTRTKSIADIVSCFKLTCKTADCVLLVLFISAYLLHSLLEGGTDLSCSNSAAVPSTCHHLLWPHHTLMSRLLLTQHVLRSCSHLIWVSVETTMILHVVRVVRPYIIDLRESIHQHAA